MNETKQQFFPGDRVRITEDFREFDSTQPDTTFLHGTKGSIGVIVTPEEFWADYVARMRQYALILSKEHKHSFNAESLISETEESKKEFITNVKGCMEANFRYPVKFETVEPSANPEAVICCQVGECQQIRVLRNVLTGEGQILEKIE